MEPPTSSNIDPFLSILQAEARAANLWQSFTQAQRDQNKEVLLELQAAVLSETETVQRRTGVLYDFGGLAQQQENRRRAVLAQLLELHELLRRAIGARSLLDLPDEILLLIFGFVRGDVPRPQKRSDVDPRYGPLFEVGPDPEAGLPFSYMDMRSRETPLLPDVTSIQNSRLVCRRFSQVSSEFLLHTIEVTPTSASLAHLDEVSRHPVISKGISLVRVVLEYHSIPVDNFMNRVIEWFERETREYLIAAGGPLGIHPHQVHLLPESTRKAEPVQEARRLSNSWRKHVDGVQVPVSDQERSDVALLQELLAEYGDQVADAKVCLQQTLVPTVAKSMLRFNQAGLHITDRASCPRRELSCFGEIFSRGDSGPGNPNTRNLGLITKDPASAVRMFLSHPHTWPHLPFSNSDMTPPTDLLFRLPLEVHKAHVDLRDLEVSVWGMWYCNPDFERELNSQDLHGLKELASKLTHFAFDAACFGRSSWYPNFARCLKTLTSGQRLQSLSLDFGNYLCLKHQVFEVLVEGGNIGLGAFLPVKLSSRLSHLALRGCSLNSSFLSTMLEQFGRGSIRLDFRELRLLDGSWAQALELLREKASGDSEVYYGRGPEFEGHYEDGLYACAQNLMYLEGPLGHAYRVIFGERVAQESVPGGATSYIRGHAGDGQLNPFRLFNWPQR